MEATQTSRSIVAPHWGVVAVALIAGVIAAGHVGKLPPALPSIRAELGMDIVTAGWLASLFNPVLAWVFARDTRRRLAALKSAVE